jgi:hypothetical protein
MRRRTSSTRPTTKLLDRPDTVVVDGLDLRAGHRQALLDSRSTIEIGIAVFAQPV